MLKRYVTALFKKQWGANLSKFNGVAMLGGVTLNGHTNIFRIINRYTRIRKRNKKLI